MSNPDRRHTAGVARRVERALGNEATDPVLAAALLHDVGKSVSGLRTYGRVIATLSAKVAGREMAEAWTQTRGFTRRVGLYLEHPRLGGDLLAMAGSDPLTEAWRASTTSRSPSGRFRPASDAPSRTPTTTDSAAIQPHLSELGGFPVPPATATPPSSEG